MRRFLTAPKLDDYCELNETNIELKWDPLENKSSVSKNPQISSQKTNNFLIRQASVFGAQPLKETYLSSHVYVCF